MFKWQQSWPMGKAFSHGVGITQAQVVANMRKHIASREQIERESLPQPSSLRRNGRKTIVLLPRSLAGNVKGSR